jgi:hypothetical protein
MKLKNVLLACLFLSPGALIAADKPSSVPATYPLKTCVVSDEPLGDMGKPVKVTHEKTDVYLCCKACLEDFNKEPGKYTDMVKKAGKK